MVGVQIVNSTQLKNGSQTKLSEFQRAQNPRQPSPRLQGFVEIEGRTLCLLSVPCFFFQLFSIKGHLHDVWLLCYRFMDSFHLPGNNPSSAVTYMQAIMHNHHIPFYQHEDKHLLLLQNCQSAGLE